MKINKTKVKRILIISLVGLLCAIVLFLSSTLVVDRVLSAKELKMLKSEGLVNLVDIGDRKINVLSYGKEDGKHTIVCMAGLGSIDFSVTMRQMTAELEKDNRVVFVDRAGYGMSEDSSNDQTNEQIVSDYRNALKNANIMPPYILMPHSIGGAYATYWESKYPDEIEAVIFVDGTQLSATAFDDEESDSTYSNLGLKLVDFFGLQRFALRGYYYLLSDNYSEHEQKLGDALVVNSMCSIALSSEESYLAQNAKEAFNSIVTNNIPKIYVCSSWGSTTKEELKEHLEWLSVQKKKNNLPTATVELTDELINKMLGQMEENRNTILKPYINKLGNCELILFGGDHMIYQQKPGGCAEILMQFLDNLG